jgi:diguanylate cyclase (GGDEF)-like protein
MAETSPLNEALAIIADCPFPLLILDRSGRVTGYNRALEQLVGAERASGLRDLNADSLDDHPLRALLTRERSVCWSDANDEQRYFEIHRTLLTEHNHLEARFFVDITRQVALENTSSRLNKELEEQTLTDPITGLLNSRGLMLALEPQVARSRRYNSPISVVMLDVNGGENGRQMLVATARLLKDQLRWADLVACTEKQQFVLVLPETQTEAALKLAGKLRQQLQALAANNDAAGPCRPCYGVTGWRRNDNAKTLLKRAAAALGRARSSQRDGDRPIAL